MAPPIQARRRAGVGFDLAVNAAKGEGSMRRDWFTGLGAFSTLAMLVGIDLLLTSMAHKGWIASRVVVKRLRAPR